MSALGSDQQPIAPAVILDGVTRTWERLRPASAALSVRRSIQSQGLAEAIIAFCDSQALDFAQFMTGVGIVLAAAILVQERVSDGSGGPPSPEILLANHVAHVKATVDTMRRCPHPSIH